MNLRRKMERMCWRSRGRGKRLITRGGEQKMWFWRRERRFVLCDTVCELFENYKLYDVENKLKIPLSLMHLSVILALPVFCFSFKLFCRIQESSQVLYKLEQAKTKQELLGNSAERHPLGILQQYKVSQ